MTSPFVGSWSYRSFQNNPDLAIYFDALRFGAGTLTLTEPTFGQVSGTLGGPGWSLALAGHYTYGNPNHARFQGSGDIDDDRWVYDYVGYLVPAWPNGVNQIPAVVGSVIRTVPHSNGLCRGVRRGAGRRHATFRHTIAHTVTVVTARTRMAPRPTCCPPNVCNDGSVGSRTTGIAVASEPALHGDGGPRLAWSRGLGMYGYTRWWPAAGRAPPPARAATASARTLSPGAYRGSLHDVLRLREIPRETVQLRHAAVLFAEIRAVGYRGGTPPCRITSGPGGLVNQRWPSRQPDY